ncbi:MAG: MBL fold metallo-hydrolase [Flavobacteriaceae bacterium]|nr:MBL fold metallo-hydrolase [Flavobacteriaceae bacterium]
MKIEQIYTGCLSQGAYYLESNGEVAIIDPLRDVDYYIETANQNNARIKYIFETHFHADFVSGHVTLAEKTGASIIYGPNAITNFHSHVAQDGEEFKLGDVKITLIHTPGHTMESSCYLLTDKAGKDIAIFTGDTLFLGDVGRPDLAQKSDHLTAEDLAGYSFESLRNKIMPLDDDIVIYPAHGAGSACGKKMSKETFDSLGNQKKTNYALREDMTKKEFIKEVLEGLNPPPEYFSSNVKLNKEGYESLDKILNRSINELTVIDFKKNVNVNGSLMLDVRSIEEFARAHIPGSIFIGLDGSFAPWVGELIKDVSHPIVLISPVGREEEAITRLSRLGFDNSKGYLKGGINAWIDSGNEVDSVESINKNEFEKLFSEVNIKIFDVRNESEFSSEHVVGACNIPLNKLNANLEKINSNSVNYIHCAGGYRSMIASSILKARGIHNFIDIKGGYSAISDSSIINKNKYVCQSQN